MITEIGCKTTVIFAQIAIIWESCTGIENGIFTEMRRSGFSQIFGSPQLKK